MSNVKVIPAKKALRFYDPRTMIAAVIAPWVMLENRSIIEATLEITKEMSHWLSEEAGTMHESDDRKPGYEDLAARLIAR
jgi:hypothetical protein